MESNPGCGCADSSESAVRWLSTPVRSRRRRRCCCSAMFCADAAGELRQIAPAALRSAAEIRTKQCAARLAAGGIQLSLDSPADAPAGDGLAAARLTSSLRPLLLLAAVSELAFRLNAAKPDCTLARSLLATDGPRRKRGRADLIRSSSGSNRASSVAGTGAARAHESRPHCNRRALPPRGR